jgi:hypothetical protein
LVAPVGLVRLDQVAGEDFAGSELGDGDVLVVGERDHAFAGVLDADPEVVHPASAAQAHPAFGVEPVVAQPVMAVRVGSGVGVPAVGFGKWLLNRRIG